MTPADITRAIEAIWRIESARLVAGLARLVRDVALAEDLAQDALVTALDQWSKQGVPDKPGALMAIAKRRAVDLFRRDKLATQKHEELARSIETLREEPDPAAALDDDLGDELLGLILISCHPLLSREARVALTLRLVGGLTTEEIARAFLASEGAIAQRIVRAKRTLSEAKVPFEIPSGHERAKRLPLSSRWSTPSSTKAIRRPPGIARERQRATEAVRKLCEILQTNEQSRVFAPLLILNAVKPRKSERNRFV
jgi:RNA polymerase sigma factor (sigma-70 family)